MSSICGHQKKGNKVIAEAQKVNPIYLYQQLVDARDCVLEEIECINAEIYDNINAMELLESNLLRAASDANDAAAE